MFIFSRRVKFDVKRIKMNKTIIINMKNKKQTKTNGKCSGSRGLKLHFRKKKKLHYSHFYDIAGCYTGANVAYLRDVNVHAQPNSPMDLKF